MQLQSTALPLTFADRRCYLDKITMISHASGSNKTSDPQVRYEKKSKGLPSLYQVYLHILII